MGGGGGGGGGRRGNSEINYEPGMYEPPKAAEPQNKEVCKITSWQSGAAALLTEPREPRTANSSINHQ